MSKAKIEDEQYCSEKVIDNKTEVSGTVIQGLESSIDSPDFETLSSEALINNRSNCREPDISTAGYSLNQELVRIDFDGSEMNFTEEEAESEFTSFMESLNLLGDPKRSSFSELCRASRVYSERFLRWRDTNQPLENIQFFHRGGDSRERFERITHQCDISSDGLLAVSLEFYCEMDEYFEIWECEIETNELKFPLYRFDLMDCVMNHFVHTELLRANLAIKVECRYSGPDFYFRFSCSNPDMFNGILGDKLDNLKKLEVIPRTEVPQTKNINIPRFYQNERFFSAAYTIAIIVVVFSGIIYSLSNSDSSRGKGKFFRISAVGVVSKPNPSPDD